MLLTVRHHFEFNASMKINVAPEGHYGALCDLTFPSRLNGGGNRQVLIIERTPPAFLSIK